MKYLILEEVDSTNSYVSCHSSELEDMTMVIANSQTAGRGQRGNSWESEVGKNLTFTMIKKNPGVMPVEQFAISEAVALAVADFLIAGGVEVRVKWPNDIYVGDKKISGILIEHALMGNRIEHTRIGVGLNVNQREFRSDAPNPVSIFQLTGSEQDISRVAASVGMQIERRLRDAEDAGKRAAAHEEFKRRLWRGEGTWPFRRREDGKEYEGRIVDVDAHGPIEIEDVATGERRSYAFKEVEFLL